jgi:hypothetical protein
MQKLDLHFDEKNGKIYEMPFKMTKDSRIQGFQIRIVHIIFQLSFT